MTTVVFDMDDTLYDEITYVHSGFNAVANMLLHQYGISHDKTMTLMKEELDRNGRGKVFDAVLNHFNIWNKNNVSRCLSAYRTHTPAIQLREDAITCLNRLSSQYPLYLVTDGNKVVQNLKVKALDIGKYMKHCFITHRYGIQHAKPSPYVFNEICKRERTTPTQVIYIGDNPHKDFIGIKPLGFRSVRIMRGNFAHIEKSPEFEASWRIHSLSELTPEFIQKVIVS